MPVLTPPTIHAPAPAATSAERFLRGLYAGYRAGGRGEAWLRPERVFAGPVLSLIRTYRARPGSGELDGDPFCGCQDWEDVRVDRVRLTGTAGRSVRAEVVFRDRDDVRRTVRFRLVRARSAWWVADMTLYGYDGEPWLTALLRRETATARPFAPLAGRYGPMLVAVTGREVRGAFSERRIGIGTEEAPQFTCRFTFAGRLRGGGARVVSRVPDGGTVRGRVTSAGAVVRLRLDADQPGCAMTSGTMARAPFEARRDRGGEGWLDVGLVTARVARLRAGPRPGPSVGQPWLVEGDGVAVLARAGQWLRVQYVAGERPEEGWLRAEEVALPPPP